MIFYQEQQKDLLFSIEEIFRDLETNANSNISRTYDIYDYYQSVDDFQAICMYFDTESISIELTIINYTTLDCSRIEADKVNVVLDFIWSTNRRIQYLSNALNVPYFKMDLTVYPFVDVLSRYIKGRHGVDSVFILQTDTEMDQALYGLIEKSSLRILVVDRLTRKTANKLLKMRPVPQYFSVAATTENMNDIFDMVRESFPWPFYAQTDFYLSRLFEVDWCGYRNDGICCSSTRFRVTSNFATAIPTLPSSWSTIHSTVNG